VLDDVLPVLRCPACARELSRAGRALRCAAGHSFDVARQGYVNLLNGRAPAGAETPAMVAARSELFDAGHLDLVSAAIVELAPDDVELTLDAGAGTGHHLAAVLRARPGRVGLALDVSKAAARRSIRAHPGLASVVADVWRRLPVADACADLLLDVFAPRHPAEFNRVLRPTGTLIVVTPMSEHLGELVGPLRLLTVDPDKTERVGESLARWFEPVRRASCRYVLSLRRAEASRFVAMGPSSWHKDPAELAGHLASWPEPVMVTVAVELTAYRPIRRD
jgi:23S rRNA (guanine745-N1)-methyltransferase